VIQKSKCIEDILTTTCFITPTTAWPRNCLTSKQRVSYRLPQDSRLDHECVFDKLDTIVHQYLTTFRNVCNLVSICTYHTVHICSTDLLLCWLACSLHGSCCCSRNTSRWTTRIATIFHRSSTTFRSVCKIVLLSMHAVASHGAALLLCLLPPGLLLLVSARTLDARARPPGVTR